MFDSDTIKLLQQAEALDRVSVELDGATIQKPVIAIPDGFSLQNIEHVFSYRQRIKGVFATDDIDSFTNYCGSHTIIGSACFVDGALMKAKTIFDYLPKGEPGHCDFSATLQLKPTAEYEAMLKLVNTQMMTQKDLAFSMEDLSHIITPINSDRKDYQLSMAIAAVRNITIESSASATFNQQDMRASRSALEEIEAKAKNAAVGLLPSFLKFTLVPYIGLAEREFRVRMVMHLSKEEPRFNLKFVSHELDKQAMANEFVDVIDQKLSGILNDVFVGGFTPTK